MLNKSRIFIYGFSGMGVQALMTLFRHPQNFRCTIAVCCHGGAMSFARWDELNDKIVYLISRESN
jgi:predicted peptidase